MGTTIQARRIPVHGFHAVRLYGIQIHHGEYCVHCRSPFQKDATIITRRWAFVNRFFQKKKMLAFVVFEEDLKKGENKDCCLVFLAFWVAVLIFCAKQHKTTQYCLKNKNKSIYWRFSRRALSTFSFSAYTDSKDVGFCRIGKE